jgi:predicted secreted protein
MIAAKVGEDFGVELKSNPTTGYRWELAEVPPGLELLDAGFAPAERGGLGSGGTQRFRLRASAPGQYVLSFRLKRSWESEAIDTHTVEVEVH